MNKAWEEMTLEELKKEKEFLSNQEYKNEWQYEFTRQEIKSIDNLIKNK